MARKQQSWAQGTGATAARRRHPMATSHRLSPAEVVEKIQQSKSAQVRSNAIRLLEKYLRRGDRFHATWNALGGARGIAILMAELSVADVRNLCTRLGRTASAANARAERRTGLAELIAILSIGDTDNRPLHKFYQSLVPGSHDEVVQSWEDDETVTWSHGQEQCLLHGHRGQYEQRFLRDIFPQPPKTSCGFGQSEDLFRGNLAFCETILKHLLSLESNKVDIPHDFSYTFAMPLLNKFDKRRRSFKAELFKFLGLMVHCVKHHPQSLSKQLSLKGSRYNLRTAHGGPSTNILAFTIRRWAREVTSDGDRELLESLLESLLALLPSPHLKLREVFEVLYLERDDHPRHAQMRYELLQLIFKNVEKYRLDLESDDPASLKRLKEVSSAKNPWPAELFMFLPTDKSLALFERLECIHQGGDFVSYKGSGASILQQEQTPLPGSLNDIDIIRTVLRRKQDPSGSSWLDGVRLLVKDRKKSATEAREPRLRSFWAKSALNLCVASGDVAMVHDTFAWAQRFIKDPLVGPEIHGSDTMTRELDALLTAVPRPIDFETMERLEEAISTAKHDTEPANKVLVTLIQTAISAIREPGFKANNWSNLLRLPGKIAQERRLAGESVRRLAEEIGAPDPASILAEIVCKPTILMLLKIEALMSDPSSSKLTAGRHDAIYSAGSYLQYLLLVEPELQAEMTTFFLQATQEHLPSALVRNQISFVIAAVSRLAHSSQPSLAIPFIRPIIQNSDDSSSHRQLITNGFLESLSAQEVTQFLYSMTETMTDMMKAQNNQPWSESKPNEPPAIKVTTIKMMANLLDGNLVVDARTSCEILVSLLREARHIDARIAIIASLLSTLEGSKSTPALREQILNVFEESVLPMASQLNERRPTTEKEWEATDMPEVSEDSSILKLLVQKISSKELRAEDRARLVQIIMRALEQSAMNNQRWMILFASKHNFELGSNDNFSVGPAHHNALEMVMSLEFEFIPDQLLERFQNMILQNVEPSPGISRITKHVQADATLRGSNAGKHWLAHFNNSGENVFSFGLDSSLRLIQKGTKSAHSQHRIDQMRHLATAVAERWMRQGLPALVFILVNRLTVHPRDEAASSVDWRGNSILALEDIVRAAEMIREEGTSLPVLPNTFQIRLSILRLTHQARDEKNPGPQIMAYAEMVSSLVDRLVSRRRPYHSDFALLKAEFIRNAYTIPTHGQAAIALARLHEGDLESTEPSLATYLRFELIAERIRLVDLSKKEDKGGIQGVVRKWTVCPTEDLRVMGQQLEIDLKKRKEWKISEDDVAMQDA